MATTFTANGKTYRMAPEPEVREEWIERAGTLLTDEWQTPFKMRMGDHVLAEMVRRGLAERKHPQQAAGVCIYRRPQS